MSTQSIDLTPVDTLFFRGAEPMVTGENHHVSILFPPMPSTILGALRTGILVQKEISFQEFTTEKTIDGNVRKLLGSPDEPGFSLTGLLFSVRQRDNELLFFPAPTHWFAPKKELEQIKEHNSEPVQIPIIPSQPLPEKAKEFGLCSSLTKEWYWAKNKDGGELVSLEGYWVTEPLLQTPDSGKALSELGQLQDHSSMEKLILPSQAFYVSETRTGIARNRDKMVKDGHLYSTTHIRLFPEVSLKVLVDKPLNEVLSPAGILQLGGEQRVVRYKLEKSPRLLQEKVVGKTWLAMSPVTSKAVAQLNPEPDGIASGKLLRIGGWEMKKGNDTDKTRGFHRSMEGWYPAGTVLFFKEPKNVADGFMVID